MSNRFGLDSRGSSASKEPLNTEAEGPMVVWDLYIYIYIETTTYCSDIQAFIVVVCYIDGLTAGWK
jgi:hypothetical protein